MRSISDDTSWMQVDQKRGRLVHPRRLLLLCDLAGVCLAFGATYIYIEARGILGSQRRITVFNCILILALALTLLLRSREYSVPKRLSSLSAMAVLVRDTAIAAAVTTLLSYLTKGFFTDNTTPSRMAVGIDLVVFLAFGMVARVVLGIVQNRQYAAGRGVRKILIAGDGVAANELIQFINRHPEMGIAAVGTMRLDLPEWSCGEREDVSAAPALPMLTVTDDLSGLKNLDNMLRRLHASEIVIALDTQDQAVLTRLATFLSLAHVPYRVIPSLFEETLLASESLGDIAVRVVDFRVTPLDRIGRFSKRVMDICMAGLLLLVLSPLLLTIALVIVLESGRPAIFAQERVGRNGHRFVLYKFRTMVKDAESRMKELEGQNEAASSGGRIFKMRNDPRITKVGSLLRRTSMDELPQFVNVLRGEMSMVGPRPPLPREVALYEREHFSRLKVLPGITGLWQVSGRSDLTFEDMVGLDRYYVDNWSLLLDLRILLKTVKALVKRDGAF